MCGELPVKQLFTAICLRQESNCLDAGTNHMRVFICYLECWNGVFEEEEEEGGREQKVRAYGHQYRVSANRLTALHRAVFCK